MKKNVSPKVLEKNWSEMKYHETFSQFFRCCVGLSCTFYRLLLSFFRKTKKTITFRNLTYKKQNQKKISRKTCLVLTHSNPCMMHYRIKSLLTCPRICLHQLHSFVCYIWPMKRFVSISFSSVPYYTKITTHAINANCSPRVD